MRTPNTQRFEKETKFLPSIMMNYLSSPSHKTVELEALMKTDLE